MGKHEQHSRRNDRSVLKGIAAGAIGGLVASWVMNQFQSALQSATGSEGKSSHKKKEPATVKTANAVSESVFGHELTEQERKVAGPGVHYAMGATSGAIYGALSELSPVVSSVAGLPFGAAVWAVADELAVPAFGLSKAPTEMPVSVHASALASHLVYGIATDVVRRALRHVW